MILKVVVLDFSTLNGTNLKLLILTPERYDWHPRLLIWESPKPPSHPPPLHPPPPPAQVSIYVSASFLQKNETL